MYFSAVCLPLKIPKALCQNLFSKYKKNKVSEELGMYFMFKLVNMAVLSIQTTIYDNSGPTSARYWVASTPTDFNEMGMRVLSIPSDCVLSYLFPSLKAHS